MKILIITEKPKVASAMAFALSSVSSRPVRKRYGRVSYYEFTKNSDLITVAPAVGHLFTFRESRVKKGKENAKEKKIPSLPVFDIEWTPTYEVNKSAWYMKDYVDNLRNLSKNSDLFINATDFDIEGHLIGYNIIRFLADPEKAKRMKFSTLASNDLRNAYENLLSIDKNNVLAGETRHIIDWFYGINLSRAIMLALASIGKRRILSIGRVQGAFLKFLIDREKEIKSFQPKDYWELFAFLKGYKFKHTQEKFFNLNKAEKAQLNTAQEGEIKIESERRSFWPLPAFDFTSLQIEAYRVFGFSPMITQKLAQSLYEDALISYPRTSSQKLPLTLNLRGIIEKLSKTIKYSKNAAEILKKGIFRPRQGKKIDPAHPAIHPTGIYKKIASEEEKIYDLITTRFLSSFAEPAEIEDKKIILQAGEESYFANSRHILSLGWLLFYPYSRIKETEIPRFTENEKIKIEKFEINKDKTKPPIRYNQASILDKLDKVEIGTKTTRAIILNTLYKRGYLSGRNIFVTPLGNEIYNIFNLYSPKIVDPELTKKLESEIEGIQSGEITKEKVVDEAKKILIESVSNIEENKEEIGKLLSKTLEETERFAKCKCGGDLKIISFKGTKFLGCTNYPKCKITYSLPKTQFSYAGICEYCGAPFIWVAKGKQRFKYCLNRECEAKRRTEREKEREKDKEGKIKMKKEKRPRKRKEKKGEEKKEEEKKGEEKKGEEKKEEEIKMGKKSKRKTKKVKKSRKKLKEKVKRIREKEQI